MYLYTINQFFNDQLNVNVNKQILKNELYNDLIESFNYDDINNELFDKINNIKFELKTFNRFTIRHNDIVFECSTTMHELTNKTITFDHDQIIKNKC